MHSRGSKSHGTTPEMERKTSTKFKIKKFSLNSYYHSRAHHDKPAKKNALGLVRSNSLGNMDNKQFVAHHEHQLATPPPHQRHNNKFGFKLKDKTKVLIKLHVIKEKAVYIGNLLKELKDVTDLAQNMTHDEELQETFVSKIVNIEAEIRLAKNLMVLLCRHKPLNKHLSALESVEEQMKTATDISVQFFGIDWDYLAKVSRDMISLLDHLLDLVQRSDDLDFEVDMGLPCNIIRDLTTIESDVTSHAEAILKGRLSQKHKDTISYEQRRHLSIISLGTSQMACAQLQRIQSEIKEMSAPVDLPEDVGKQKFWENFRNQFNVPYLFRHFRRPSPRHHEELWRTWYNGIQSVTVSVPMMSDLNETESSNVSVSPKANPLFISQPPTPSETLSRRPRRDSVSSTAFEHMRSMKAKVGKSFSLRRSLSIRRLSNTSLRSAPPSSEDQRTVLGSYSCSMEHLTPGLSQKEALKAFRMASKENIGINLEAFELAGCVQAPLQKIDEDEL